LIVCYETLDTDNVIYDRIVVRGEEICNMDIEGRPIAQMHY